MEKERRAPKKKQALDSQISVRITSEERQKMEELCQRLGFYDISSFVRLAIQEAIIKFEQMDIWDYLREKKKENK